jgi:hypothetical protein
MGHIIDLGIVEDSYALSVACKQTLTSLLRLLNAYRHESDYTVLSHVTSVSKTCTFNKDFDHFSYVYIIYVWCLNFDHQVNVSSLFPGMFRR